MSEAYDTLQSVSLKRLAPEEELPPGFHVEPEDPGPVPYTVAGPVKVTKRDGSVEWQEPLSEDQFRQVVT